MAKRSHINMETKLAAALLSRGEIPYEDSKLMTASQICSLYHFDHHPIRVADGGETVPWNLTPRFIGEHRAKTAKIDQPQLAKQRRIRARLVEHKIAMDKTLAAADRGGRKRKISSRLDDIVDLADVFGYGPSAPGWREPAKPKRKIPSRPFSAGRKFSNNQKQV
jgi:hypothetical protein